jgi:hypothetical protein
MQRDGIGDFRTSSVDGVLNNLKIYNYCKTDFIDSLSLDNVYIEESGLKNPQQFIEISKDNVTFYNTESGQLPLFFDDVPEGTTVPVWVKITLPKDLTGKEERTAKILGSWNIGV